MSSDKNPPPYLNLNNLMIAACIVFFIFAVTSALSFTRLGQIHKMELPREAAISIFKVTQLEFVQMVAVSILLFAIFLPLAFYAQRQLQNLRRTTATLEDHMKNLYDTRAATISILEDAHIAWKEADLKERQIERYARALQTSNKELESFAYVASHDLKEPLSKIAFFASQLKEYSKNSDHEKVQDSVERIQKAIGRMERLINDLLDFSRIQRKPDQIKRVDLNKIVQEVIADLDVRIQELQAQITIEALPLITGQELQMRQLFQNLLANALKFHRKEVAPHIDVRCQRLGGDGIQITVADNGIGFENDYKDKIFEPFERLHPRSVYEGTGLGLAICKKIVEHHGGQIRAESQLGVGTEFIIHFPLPS